MRVRLLLLLCAIASSSCWAEVVGRVVKVHDGDTLTVLVEQKEIRVRLEGIDAPELAQPFGRRSRESLADLCAARLATLGARGKDRYGRTIAQVSCAGVDAGDEQVRRGMAWVYVQYVPLGSALHALERDARVARRGLWVDALPVAPWEWRRRSK